MAVTVRVVAGEWRGRTLRAPRGRDVRPTPDRVREALFSILGPDALEGRVLDLFAGTGALGIEALSRGAPTALFVENARESLRLLRSNLETVGAGERATVLPRSVFGLRPRDLGDPPFGLVLADPPYAVVDRPDSRARLGEALGRLVSSVAEDGIVVVEHRRAAPGPAVDGLAVTDRREYGDTALTLYRRVESTA